MKLFFIIIILFQYPILYSKNKSPNIFIKEEPKPQLFKKSLLLNGHLGSNSKAIGAKFIGNKSLKIAPKFSLGFNGAFEKIWFTENVFIPSNITTNILFGTIGVNLSYQINDQLFFQPEISLLFGKQDIKTLISTPSAFNSYGYATSYKFSEINKTKNLLGAHLEQHLLYYPKKAKSLVLGISIFERILNAEYYDTDAGICGYLGINF